MLVGRISMGNAFLSTNGLLTARVGWSLGDSVSASCSLNEMYFFRLFGILARALKMPWYRNVAADAAAAKTDTI